MKKCKVCPKCKIEKSVEEFSKSIKQYDGLQSYCKTCFKKYLNDNKEKLIKYKKQYACYNKEKIQKYQKEYRNIHKKQRTRYKKEYEKQRCQIDLIYKLKQNMRTRIWQVLKNKNKSQSTIKLIGCSIEFLKSHLESNFTSAMSWNNYGNGWRGKQEWHVDHIRPCASFDLSDPEEQKQCFHYKNLQPLWAIDNLRKSDKY